MKTGILPIIKAVNERISLLQYDHLDDATRIIAKAELEIIKKKLVELRAFLAHEKAEAASE
jgi:hypothetical protein